MDFCLAARHAWRSTLAGLGTNVTTMKNLLLCVLACCLISRAWAQKTQPPVCRIGELSRPFNVSESVTIAGASKATVVGRAMYWASKVALPSAHPVDTTTDGGTLRVLVEGSWPYRYTIAGKSQTASLHFVAELIPEDSTCWYTFSQLVLRTPSSSLSAAYLMRKNSPANRELKPAQLEALRTRFMDSLNALITGLDAAMNKATAKTGTSR
jgi:hypothetical protein